MRKETLSAILTMAKADSTATPEQLTAIEGICLGHGIRKKLINSRLARIILGEPEGRSISGPTLRSYVRKGQLHPIRLSSRKIRYDEYEVRDLLNFGVDNE